MPFYRDIGDSPAPPNVLGNIRVTISGGRGAGAGNKTLPTDPANTSNSPSLADQIAATIAAIGLTNSPLAGDSTRPVLMQKGNNQVAIYLVIATLLVAWYFMRKKKGKNNER